MHRISNHRPCFMSLYDSALLSEFMVAHPMCGHHTCKFQRARNHFLHKVPSHPFPSEVEYKGKATSYLLAIHHKTMNTKIGIMMSGSQRANSRATLCPSHHALLRNIQHRQRGEDLALAIHPGAPKSLPTENLEFAAC